MKVLIIGATGGTGRAVVSAAKAAGHEVTALVRSAEKAVDLPIDHLLEGSVLDPAALARAMQGIEAVISVLGTKLSPIREVRLLSQATELMVQQMQQAGVRRFICVTGMGAGDSRGHGGALFDGLLLPLLLCKIYQDKNRQEAVIKSSDLDWTIVRPSVLSDRPGRQSYRALTDLSAFHGGSIARADVAHFLVQQLSSDDWLRKTPLISD
ncbi:SDR family oxidoreductase [Saccharospirillum sp. HFRX-1]|uniref:NAD(P)-dependent oxidoreductase n=1 Tax=unclassified Saccharospirillum TaxID=2633430 RepID=UPI0037239046